LPRLRPDKLKAALEGRTLMHALAHARQPVSQAWTGGYTEVFERRRAIADIALERLNTCRVPVCEFRFKA